MEVDCATVDDDEFGEVISGHLTISARIAQVYLYREVLFEDDQEILAFTNISKVGHNWTFSTPLDYPVDISQGWTKVDAPNGNNGIEYSPNKKKIWFRKDEIFYCVRIAEGWGERWVMSGLSGLLLRHLHESENTFERVGLVRENPGLHVVFDDVDADTIIKII